MEKQKMDRKQEKFKILKFGGTSLGTVERIKHVANLICNNELNLVVLSAMSGTTNSLAEIASLLFNGDIDGAQRETLSVWKASISKSPISSIFLQRA